MATQDNATNITEQNLASKKTGLQNAESDIYDSPQDEEKMKPEFVILDLPDVSDIPGQENIVVPRMKEMYDTTISSDDEEGVGLFDDEDDEDSDLIMGNDADVSSAEKTLLQSAGESTPDEDYNALKSAELDMTDDDGDPLNEGSLATDVSGSDLDTPGADADDDMEAIGEEDEENNAYSLGGDDKENDNDTTGNP